MTEPTACANSAVAPRGKMLGLRSVLAAVAMFEALWEFLFSDRSGFDHNETISGAHLAGHPLLALVALVFAATGRVRHAIIALGTAEMLTWLNQLPEPGRLEFNSGWDIQWATKQIVAFPLMAAFAMTLSARDTRPGLATALVSIITLNNLLGFMTFAIGIIINGP
jgi:hypothetical protein